MLLGKSYVNASFTLSGVTITRGFTVCVKSNCIKTESEVYILLDCF